MSNRVTVRFLVREPFRRGLSYIVHTNIFFQRDIEHLLNLKHDSYEVFPIITLDELPIIKYRFRILRALLDHGIDTVFVYSPKLSTVFRYVDYAEFLLRYINVAFVVYFCDGDLTVLEYLKGKYHRVMLYLYYFPYIDNLMEKIDGLVVASRYFERKGKCAIPVPCRYVTSLLVRAGKMVRTFGKELIIDISDIEPRRVLQ